MVRVGRLGLAVQQCTGDDARDDRIVFVGRQAPAATTVMLAMVVATL
jgi:hypothetical protein